MSALQRVPVPLQLVCSKHLMLLRVVIDIGHDDHYEHTFKENSCGQI